MSDDDDEMCKYGTPLPPYNEDEIPSKKPFDITDQIAVDVNGRRRFHGAFTGGFSAGYWNTVGSQEGWKPQSFKSSRKEKAEQLKQTPNDFMDDEDIGEFGIAPQRIQTTDDFTPDEAQTSSTHKKRKLQRVNNNDGPIPGIPVLNMFLQSTHDKIAVKLLKYMGWKEQQGIGARQTQSEKKKAICRNARENTNIGKFYQCDMGPIQKSIDINATIDESNESENSIDDDDDDDNEITFAPDDFDSIVLEMKNNRFGLGYVSLLNRDPVLQQQKHINLFNSFEVVDKNNKKLSIRGQAFGVGAFEEDDDDIYAGDNLAAYDFTLGGDKKQKIDKKALNNSTNIIAGFCSAVEINNRKSLQNKIFKINMPERFSPRNWAKRKTRFGPPKIESKNESDDNKLEKQQNFGRHILTPEERGVILNDDKTISQPSTSILLKKSIDFTASNSNSSNETKIINFTASSEDKKNFIKLEDVKPKINYIPNMPSMDRFISENDIVAEKPALQLAISDEKPEKKTFRKHRMPWKPVPLLCQRMNVAEPYGSGAIQEEKKQKKFSLFDCLTFTVETNIPPPPPPLPSPISLSSSSSPLSSTIPIVPSSKPDLQDVQQQQQSKLNNDQFNLNKVKIEKPTDKTDLIPQVPITSSTILNLNNLNINRKPIQKSEFEIKIINAQNKHPSEKKDIFKAIFENSSSEDEDAVDNNTKTDKLNSNSNNNNNNEITNLPKFAADINILRNTSPPRGIFANFLTTNTTTNKINSSSVILPSPTVLQQNLESNNDTKIADTDINAHTIIETPLKSTIKFRTKEQRMSGSDVASQQLNEGLLYGPKLPDKNKFDKTSTSSIIKSTEQHINKHGMETGIEASSSEKWVEKDAIHKKKKKHKEKKKHKKEKHKSKKKKK